MSAEKQQAWTDVLAFLAPTQGKSPFVSERDVVAKWFDVVSRHSVRVGRR